MLRLATVKKIQKNWLIYKLLSVGPKIKKARKANAAIMIQKHLKGYLTNKKALRQLMEKKCDETFVYFDRIAKHRIQSAIIKCQYWGKKACKRIRIRKDLQALMVNKKGGKKG